MAIIKDTNPEINERPKLSERAQGRPTGRVPINGDERNVLSVIGKEEGFHYVWVNDYNVEKFVDASYEMVTHDVKVGSRKINSDSSLGSSTVSKAVGNGVIGYLMRIPNELYTEDMKSLDREADAKEDAIFSNMRSSGLTQKIQAGVTYR